MGGNSERDFLKNKEIKNFTKLFVSCLDVENFGNLFNNLEKKIINLIDIFRKMESISDKKLFLSLLIDQNRNGKKISSRVMGTPIFCKCKAFFKQDVLFSEICDNFVYNVYSSYNFYNLLHFDIEILKNFPVSVTSITFLSKMVKGVLTSNPKNLKKKHFFFILFFFFFLLFKMKMEKFYCMSWIMWTKKKIKIY